MKKLLALVALLALLAPFSILTTRGAEGIAVNLRIEGSGATFFDGPVTVTNCTVTDTTGVAHSLSNVVACALVEAAASAGFTYDFQDFGFGLFLKRIGADDTPADFSKSWGFFVSYDPASVGVDTYTVSAGDDLLLAYSAYPGVPLRITAPAELTAGTEATFTVEKRVGESDANFVWHGRWEPAEGATLKLGDTLYGVPVTGSVTATVPISSTTIAQATGSGFVRSARTTLTIQAAATSTPSPSPTPSPTPTLSPTPTPSPTPTLTSLPAASIFSNTRQAAATRAMNYLKSKQQTDGSIDGAIVTGWAAMAFGSHNERFTPDALITYNPESTTDIERHLLAVRAAGANPRAFGGRDLVSLLKQHSSNNQIGDPALLNDDIFGVLALLAGGESVNSNEIRSTVETIINKQGSAGVWENLDLTAAAIQALKAYDNKGGSVEVGAAVSKARTFLRHNQDSKGGFGENSATTSWALQAIVALGEDPNLWLASNNKTPWNALLSYQNNSGAFGWKSDSDISSFMTTYAVPALLSAPWPIDGLSISTVATGGQVLATITPTPSPSAIPRVASITTTAPMSTTSLSPTSFPLATPIITSTLTPASPTTPLGFVPLNSSDLSFAFTLFGLANIGVGVTLTRLVSKLFGL